MRKFSSVRFVLAALTVCFLFCGFSLSAAETGEFSYYTDEEGAHVTAFNGSDAHIVIPDELGGKPVVSVSLNDCADRLGVARITLSENVVRLDDHAFYGFQHLQIVDGLDQIQYVGEQAFAFCSLTDLVFSDELKHIGARAFEYGALTNLTIPDDITYDTATFTCWTLTKITLTDGSGEKKLSMKDEVLFNADYTYLAAYPVKNPRCAYKIPDSVTYVDWTAFHCAGNPLCELEVPASVIGGAPTDIDILGKLVMRVYEGTAGHAMAKHLSGVYDKNGFEYVLLDSGDPGEALSDFVARIVAQTTDGSMTEYQKALRLHDWLTAHAQYDQTFTHMTAHDLFTYGLGICCSYSDAYSWLLSEAGIQSKVVGNYDHALVAARLDGRWTYIDPTHNDDKVDKPYFGMNDVMFKHRYGALYPDHFNNMIVVTEKLNTSSVKSHYWYREGWHKDALYYLENEIKTHIMRGETSFIVKTTDIPIYVEPMMVMLCAGLVDEDGIKVNDTAYDLVCSIHESGDWYVFVNDGLENDDKRFKFDIKNGAIRITEYTGTDVKVVIPDRLSGLPVKYIGEAAFRMNSLLEEVVFPQGLIEIEGNAFYNCLSLKKINIPSSLQYIGQEAFDSCYKLETDIILPEGFVQLGPQAFERCKRITRVHISGTASVGDAAFAECDKLSSVTIAEGFLNLSGALFSQCSALTSVVLPESLVYIDSNAFCRTGLTDIRIPKNVFFIDGSAFQECRMLKNVTLDANNANFILRSGVIYTADAKTIVLGIPAMMDENFVVPGTVESIQSRAFFGNGQLRSVYIPSSVKLIAREAFSDCSNLTSIFMEDGCTTLEYCCFGMQGGGGRETTVRLASTVSNLEYGVLCGRPIKSFAMPFESKALPSWACGTPSTIYTHRNVHELGIIPYAYEVTVYGYTGSAAEKWAQENDAEFIPYTPKELACITIKPGEKLALAGFGEHYAARWYSTDERIASISDNGVLTAISNGKCVIEGEVETKNGTIEVYTGIVSVSQEESPALPAGLNVLGAHAFEGCALTEIHIPSGMKEIPDGAFANNPYLAYVYIPNTVDHIADNAFSGCSGSITIVAPKDSKAHLFAVSRGLRFMLLK